MNKQFSFNILLADDDPKVHNSLQQCLPGHWKIISAYSPSEVPDTEYNAALVDMHLTEDTSKATGVQLIRKLRTSHPKLEVIAISGNLDQNLMESCLDAGASRFLAKPLCHEEVLLALEKVEAYIGLQKTSLNPNHNKPQWIGNSPASQEVKRNLADLKGEAAPILIEGESGTGKEVVAHILHQHSPNTPFVSVNVAAIPENLFESVFFGHKKGSFTGADANQVGLAEAANGGTLFIDEIEALRPTHQAKLLRFLESGEVQRVGTNTYQKVTCKIISASNKDLSLMVRDGEFREDLLWRLAGHRLQLPPLRNRAGDISDLTKYFLSKDSYRKKQLSKEAIAELEKLEWPGNVRELKRCCEHLSAFAPLPVIRVEDVHNATQLNSTQTKSALNQGIDLKVGLNGLLSRFESEVIAKALDSYNDIDEVGKVLAISRSSLYKKIKDHGIEWRNG